MKFRKFLKQWLGYTRRERTGSIVLLFVLLLVITIRTIRTGGGGEDVRVSSLATSTRASDSVRRSPESSGTESEDRETEAPLSHAPISSPVRQSFAEAGSAPGYGGQGKAEDGNGQEMSHSALLSTSSAKINIKNPGWDSVDINRADSAGLEALPGIGPVLSARIVKYRYLIGYFYRIDQLNEVYGLDMEVIEMNRDRLKCDSSMVRKININTAAYSDLLRHPYINQVQVEAIINFRRLSGSFTDMSELIYNRIFSNDELVRIRPYLELE